MRLQDYSRSPKVGNPKASILKSGTSGIPALIVLKPISKFWGVYYQGTGAPSATLHSYLESARNCGVSTISAKNRFVARHGNQCIFTISNIINSIISIIIVLSSTSASLQFNRLNHAHHDDCHHCRYHQPLLLFLTLHPSIEGRPIMTAGTGASYGLSAML